MVSNGRIPLEQLLRVDAAGHYLQIDFAGVWLKLVRECKAATGVTLTITPGANAYRDFAAQVVEHDNDPARAAQPGYSPHGWGLAVDVYNWADVDGWFDANLVHYGIVRDVAGEGWHLHYIGPTPLGYSADAVAAVQGTTITKQQEIIMRNWTVVNYDDGADTLPRWVLISEFDTIDIGANGLDGDSATQILNAIESKDPRGLGPNALKVIGEMQRRYIALHQTKTAGVPGASSSVVQLAAGEAAKIADLVADEQADRLKA